jgi:DNA polymerase III delta subunit-like protein
MIDGRFDVVGAAGPKHFFEGLTDATLSHGYLFAGPAGVGKKTFALRLAQSLLCVTPKSTLLGYCGTCSGCTRVEGGVHPDLYFAEGQVKIGEREGSGFHSAEEATARDLVRQLSMHSYAGGRRVFVLGDVDFTREAANALLKFFEEPPPGVVLLLTTTAVARLLPTVRSRLLEVTFPLLTNHEVASILEREGVEPDVAAHAAEIAGGSVTRARTLLDGEGSMRDAVVEWFFATLEGGTADATGWAQRPTLEEGLEVVKTLTRDWLALRVGGPDVPLLARDQADRIGRLPQRDPVAIARALGAIGDAERVARTNVSPALVADLAKMALAAVRTAA